MGISVSTGLSKPESDKKISAGTLAYINTRTLLRAHTLVIKELKQSGISQGQLARRLGKAPEVVSRMLSRPRNLELKTLSELLFAISGAVLTFSISRPLESSDSNKPNFYKSPATAEGAIAKPGNVHIRRDGIKLAMAD